MEGRDLNSIVCPMYLRNEHHAITCEGLYDTSVIVQQFGDDQKRRLHTDIFCTSQRYTCCEIYRAIIEANYADEDEEE